MPEFSKFDSNFPRELYEPKNLISTHWIKNYNDQTRYLGVSRYHGGSIEGPPETPQHPSQHYGIEGLKWGPQLGQEKLVCRIADYQVFPVYTRVDRTRYLVRYSYIKNKVKQFYLPGGKVLKIKGNKCIYWFTTRL